MKKISACEWTRAVQTRIVQGQMCLSLKTASCPSVTCFLSGSKVGFGPETQTLHPVQCPQGHQAAPVWTSCGRMPPDSDGTENLCSQLPSPDYTVWALAVLLPPMWCASVDRSQLPVAMPPVLLRTLGRGNGPQRDTVSFASVCLGYSHIHFA